MSDRSSTTAHQWRASTEHALRLTAVVWAATWLGIVSLASAINGFGRSSGPMMGWLLGLTACSWVVLAAVPVAPAAQFAVVLATSALAAVAIGDPPTPEHGLAASALWLVTASVSFAMLMAPARSATAIPILAVAALVLASGDVVRYAGDRGWQSAAILGASTLCGGMAVWVATRALRVASDVADRETDLSRRQSLAAAAADAHRREVERLARLLHDTCINTLGAIRNGAGRRDRTAVRARCAYDLAQMDPLAHDVGAKSLPHLPDLAAAVRRDAEHLGLTASVTLAGDVRYPLNPTVWNAACGATREALVNVAKHAREPRADVAISNVGEFVSITVVDAGPGWTGSAPPGGGIERSIVERVEASGGLVRIFTQADSPTEIVMTWPRAVALVPDYEQPVPDPTTPVAFEPAEPARLDIRNVAIGSGGWIVTYCLIALMLTPSLPLARVVLAITVLIACLWFTARFAQHPQPWWITVLLSTGAAVVVALPADAEGVCAASAGYGAGSAGATVLVMLVCLFGRSWWQPVLALLAFAGGLMWSHRPGLALSSECATESVVAMGLEIAAVVAILSFRRIFMRLRTQTARLHTLAAAREDVAAREEAEQRARDARVRALVTGAGPLLRQIADGALDPADPLVMERAGREETALRSLLVLSSELGPLGDTLTAAVLDAMEAGRRLDIRSGERVPLPTDEQVAILGQLVTAAVNATPIEASLPIALFARGTGGALTLVVASDDSVLPAEVLERLARGGISVSQIPLENETLLEAQWQTP